MWQSLHHQSTNWDDIDPSSQQLLQQITGIFGCGNNSSSQSVRALSDSWQLFVTQVTSWMNYKRKLQDLVFRPGALRQGWPHCPRLAGGARGESGGHTWRVTGREVSVISHRDGDKLRDNQRCLRQWEDAAETCKLLLPPPRWAEGAS